MVSAMTTSWIATIRTKVRGTSEESFSLLELKWAMLLVGSAARKIEVMLSCADREEAIDAVEAEAIDMAEAPDLHPHQQSELRSHP